MGSIVRRAGKGPGLPRKANVDSDSTSGPIDQNQRREVIDAVADGEER